MKINFKLFPYNKNYSHEFLSTNASQAEIDSYVKD